MSNIAIYEFITPWYFNVIQKNNGWRIVLFP